MDTAYQYLPLAPEEIRVMVLFKGRQEDSLECKLYHVHLKTFSPRQWKHKTKQFFQSKNRDKPHSYEALSYVWGSPSMTEALGCDGKSICITPNLRDALQWLRLADRHRALWVDQVCIKQSDADERSSQVALMGRIYTTAKQVVAWLGPDPSGHCKHAREFLVSVSQGKFGSLGGLYLPDSARLEACGLPQIDHAAWKALNSLVCLPYFGRAWILQEVVLARSVIFVWGEWQFPYLYLESLGDWLNNNPSLYSGPAPLLDITGVNCVTTLRVDPEGLFQELILHSVLRARTDPRDLVYSILGLVKSGPRIQPDYRKNELEVFRDVTLQAIAHRRNLDILFTLHHATEEDLNPCQWPTWVPRWTERPPVLVGSRDRLFNSSKSELFDEPVVPADSRTLQIEGRRLASISYVVSLGPVDTEERLQFQRTGHFIEQIWTAWCMANESFTVKAKYSALIKAFIFTLLCGLPYTWNPKNEPWEICYGSFATWWTDQLLEYSLSENFPHDPEDYISKRIGLATLAMLAARQNFQASESAELKDLMPLISLTSLLREKYGYSTANNILDLATDTFSQSRFQGFSRYWAVSGLMRDFFILSDGHIGVGPRVMKEDDVVAILSGGKVPYILRPFNNSEYMFLGECYVHGIMFGEAYEGYDKRTFNLV